MHGRVQVEKEEQVRRRKEKDQPLDSGKVNKADEESLQLHGNYASELWEAHERMRCD